ncbi:bifunctional metallophosphatase/5'-nucleotidase [Lipingzhangella sp. LS1_29]|uniref:Bifunctional metallophosphatase/5'-nucleotidase n=1 Tax=Lipingzhangella rawalii TaxID=2055835 RepID=A0ABU2H9S2_9ACTN|nr:bifunctional metallophosphatase/5'-nucleotidase [Lipingzhangella rawalii]MDS1272038.1 bifunctional metallophosphatase/5'-nucleotidase [Lipingzhangella rawalii]
MTVRTVLRVGGASALACGLTLGLAAGAAADPHDRTHYTLTILHANDTESHLLGAPSAPNFGGVARFTTLLNDLQAAERHPRSAEGAEAHRRGVLSVHTGDTFLAGPEFGASLREDTPYYDALALGYADYDAIAIGNHEFDFGPQTFAEFVEATPGDTPWLSANLDFSDVAELAQLEADGVLAPSTVVRERGTDIGLVGAVTPLLRELSNPGAVEVADDLRAVVQDEVDRLTAEGVDTIILISHLQGIAHDRELIRELTDVDAAIAGGGHETHAPEDTPLVPGDEVPTDPATGEPLHYPLWVSDAEGTDVPIVTAGDNYKYVGRLVLNFDRSGDLMSVSERSGPLRVSGVGADAVEPHPDVHAEITTPVQQHVDSLGESVLAVSEVDLEGRRNPGVRTEETNLGNLLADALLAAGQDHAADLDVPAPQIALQNGGGIRNGSLIPAGELTELDTHNIAAFSNFVAVVPEVPREQVKELLENGVSELPAADGRFAQVAGLSFTYDVERTAQVLDAEGRVLEPGERVREVTLDDGTVLVDDGEVVAGPDIHVATNDFSAGGGDQYPFRGADYVSAPLTYQQALAEHLSTNLDGQVRAADYPEGGEGRITAAN